MKPLNSIKNAVTTGLDKAGELKHRVEEKVHEKVHQVLHRGDAAKAKDVLEANAPPETNGTTLAPTDGEFVTFRSYSPVNDPSQLRADDSLAMQLVEQIRQETGMARPLQGKKFAVVLEALFIPEEMKAYATMIRELGGQLELASNLWGQPQLTFASHVEGDWNNLKPAQSLNVSKDIVKDVIPNLKDYAGVIFSANYTTKRLNYTPEAGSVRTSNEVFSAYQNTPQGQLVDAVMNSPHLVKAFNCHAIWALMTHPEHAKGLKMAYNPVLEGEAHAMGIEFAPVPAGTDIHQHTYADGPVVSSAAGVNGGTENLVRTLVGAVLANQQVPEAP